MRGQLAQRVQVVHRHAEEPVHLRRVQCHRQYPVGPGRHHEVGHQPAADRDARRVLLVRARVRVVRHHHGRPRGRGALGRVQHEQQLDQVLLDRRHERLDEVDVALPAVGLQLHFEAIVGESLHAYRLQRRLQVPADLLRQFRMGAAAEDRDVAHLSHSIQREKFDDHVCLR